MKYAVTVDPVYAVAAFHDRLTCEYEAAVAANPVGTEGGSVAAGVTADDNRDSFPAASNADTAYE